MRIIKATIEKTDGTQQLVRLNHVSLEWIKEHNVNAIEYHYVEPERLCATCPTSIDDYPAFVKRCSACYYQITI